MKSSQFGQMGLSQAEADATENLLVHIPKSLREEMARLAMTHGMARGPLSHAGVASKAWRLAYRPACEADWYRDRVGNTPETLHLMLRRLEKDWLSQPQAMRRMANNDTVIHLQKPLGSAHGTLKPPGTFGVSTDPAKLGSVQHPPWFFLSFF